LHPDQNRVALKKEMMIAVKGRDEGSNPQISTRKVQVEKG
jgi:hypothetical protein